MFNHQNKKGTISILLVIFILTSVFIIAFGLSEIFLKQLKMTSRSSDSIKAYQAADSGIEWALNRVKEGKAIPSDRLCEQDKWESINGAEYCLEITAGDKTDPEGIKSIGKLGNVRRAIEVALAQSYQGCYVSYINDPTDAACLSGFTNMGSLGQWGYCFSGAYLAYFLPPGASCYGGDTTRTSDDAYLCCQ